MRDRRQFLRLAAFSAAVVALPGVAQAAPAPGSAGEAPWWLVHPFGPGADLGLGWRLVTLFPPVEGAVTVTLAHEDGRAARIDLSLIEGSPKGPARSEFVDFIVMDGGDGQRPMEESLGRVVRRLAEAVTANESADLATLSRLLPHADRVWRYPDSLAQAAQRLAPGTT